LYSIYTMNMKSICSVHYQPFLGILLSLLFSWYQSNMLGEGETVVVYDSLPQWRIPQNVVFPGRLPPVWRSATNMPLVWRRVSYPFEEVPQSYHRFGEEPLSNWKRALTENYRLGIPFIYNKPITFLFTLSILLKSI